MKKILAYIAFSFTAITSYATTPLWMRDVQISPDGTEIVFCYKGDIYKVPTEGGAATQLTTQDSYECTPVWSPDGKQIAFASDRNGNFLQSADAPNKYWAPLPKRYVLTSPATAFSIRTAREVKMNGESTILLPSPAMCGCTIPKQVHTPTLPSMQAKIATR